MSKTIKIGVGGAFIAFFIFIAALLGHIAYMVGNRPAASFYQLARVDFDQRPTAADEQRINQALQARQGVIGTFFNAKASTLVFKYDTRYATADAIFRQAIQRQVPGCRRFIVPAALAETGCPVLSDKSFYGRLTNLVASAMY